MPGGAPPAVLLIRRAVGLVFLPEGRKRFLFPADWGVGRFIRIGIPHPACGDPSGHRREGGPSPDRFGQRVGTVYRDCRRPLGHPGWLLATLALLAAGCGQGPPALSRYTPRTRRLTVTTVPLLVSEARKMYPFLAAAFAPGGVLEGKEVYAFSPSTLTVVEGDTVHFTFVNPEDDAHTVFMADCPGADHESFGRPGCGIGLPGGTETRATYIARQAGIYSFICTVPMHAPMMYGQLVVLAPAGVAGRTGPPE